MALNHFPHVYSPIQIGNMRLKNRLQYSPIVSNHADFETGRITFELTKFIEQQAKTGAGLITIGSTPIDFDRGRDFYGCLSATSYGDMAGLSTLADTAHRFGAKLSVELIHAGQWADPNSLGGKKAYVPSVVAPYHDPDRFEEIGREEMRALLDTWKAAVDRCMRAGFDMVMVHMAHGNLLSSFLSPAFNERTDEYGGTPENRWRYPLEVLEAVHSVTQGKIPIEIRVTGSDHIEGCTSLEERIEFLKRAQKYADMVIVSAGLLKYSDDALCRNMPGYYTPKMLNVDYAAEMKKNIDIPVSVVGGINSLEDAEEIISSGKADIVAMAKAFMADDQFAIKGERGQERDIRPCMRCMYCLRPVGVGSPLMGCAVNPRMGLEYLYPYMHPPVYKKKVMIVGGGPSGMEAAQILRARGHDVVLYERTQELGGRLKEASALPLKVDFRRYFEYTVRKTMECGAKVVLGTEVTPEVIAAEAPDALIVAIGADTKIPDIPGIDGAHVHSVSAVERGEVKTGEHVVVCGGGSSGAECALQLAMEGKKVTLVGKKPWDELCGNMIIFNRHPMMKMLREKGVGYVGEAVVEEFTAGGVRVRTPEGERLIECDDAVYAFGLQPDSGLIERLTDMVPEAYVVGDAVKPGLIGDATNQAFHFAMMI